LKESEGNVRASFCSNGGVDSGSESENMFLATFSSELGLVNDKNNVMSSDSKVDCEINRKFLFNVINIELALCLTEIVNNVELDLESEFICSVNFEKAAELYVREYGKKRGFVIKRYRMQLSSDGLVKKTLVCENTGIYKPIKSKSIEQQCNKDFSNAIQKIKRKYKITGSDASQMLKYLLEKQKNKPIMFIQPLIITDKKEKSWQTNMQLAYEILRENTNSYYKIKLSNGRVLDIDTVKDPLEHISKGRRSNKRLKAYNKKSAVINQKENKYNIDNSDTNNIVGGCKCGLCHKTSHYAPKCPTKNSDF
ncbi:22840_t:CDS:2, partial [Gigaspora rosea]